MAIFPFQERWREPSKFIHPGTPTYVQLPKSLLSNRPLFSVYVCDGVKVIDMITKNIVL